jgi:DNA-directed RNA polymerase subunit M/transcription elongation factor TFIIS
MEVEKFMEPSTTSRGVHVKNQFYGVISRKLFDEPPLANDQVKKWIDQFVLHLATASVQVPTYLQDFRVPLPFRVFAENNTPLPCHLGSIRMQTSVRLWMDIFDTMVSGPDIYAAINACAVSDFYNKYQTQCVNKVVASVTERETSPVKAFIQEMKEEKRVQVGLFPCSECKSSEFVTSRSEQRRRSDEGMTTINTCSTCNRTWKS